MYTQCPECGTAFRVTAEVLKQAAGKVRCGGCGVAFNALDYLSEQKPVDSNEPAGDASTPELQPDRSGTGEAPRAISAEQSAALLKTLDDLAGEEVRIEDTGVEWRVLDETEDSGARPVEDVEDRDDTGSMKWFLDESPTPVDEPLSDAPGEMDAPEIFAAESEKPASAEEMRFDDDTPLPEDFDFDAEPAKSEPKPEIETRDAPTDSEDVQVDLALGEPEDWEDLLGEVAEAREPEEETREKTLAEELEALPAEHSQPEHPLETEDVETAAQDEVDNLVATAFDEPIPDVDKQFDTLAEAMGIDLSGMHARLDEESIALEADQYDVDDIEDTSIEDDLIAAAFEVEERERQAAKPDAEDGPDAEEGTGAQEEDEDFEELEFELELEDNPDLVEAHDRELVVRTEADAKLAAELGLENELSIADVGDEAPEESLEPENPEHVVPPMTEEEQTVNMMIDEELLAIAVTDEDGFTSTIVQKQDASVAPAPIEAIGNDAETGDEQEDREEDVEAQAGTNEDEIGEGEAISSDEADGEQHDDDPSAEVDKSTEDEPSTEIEQLAASGDALVETIIMEGDFVRDLEEEEKLEEARRKTGDPNLKSAAAADVTDLRERDETAPAPPINWGLVASITALALLLILQVLHQSREALAVHPAYNNTFGAIYRVLGKPITPSWDVSGWRFERSNATVEGEDEYALRIYSEVGNKSDEPLPYPLINVSLTNRYQDVIGSKLLEPGDYLPEDLDTRQPVEPGTNFAALFSVTAPEADVYGFKLDVCYRYSGTKLKCAADDFKR